MPHTPDHIPKVGDPIPGTDLSYEQADIANLGTITSSDFITTPTLQFQTPKPTEPFPVKDIPIPELVPTKPETEATDFTKQLQELQGRLSGQSTLRTQKEQELGVEGFRKTQLDLTNQLKALQAEAEATKISPEFEQKNVLTPFAEGERARKLRDVGVRALIVGANLQAAQGNLASALDSVERSVRQRFDPILEEIAIKKANLDLILQSPEFNRADKERALRQKALQEQQEQGVRQQEREQEAIWKIGIEAAQARADAVTLRDIQNSKTAIEATQKAAPFLGRKGDDLLSINEAKALGVPFGTTRQQALGITPKASEKPATQAQQTVAGYAARLEQSEPTLKTLENSISGMSLASFEIQRRAPATFQSANMQQYMQASRNFINAVLRRESGAVISPSEFSEARQQYLPTPGDTAETLKQKELNRKLVFQNLKQAAGTAFTSVDELLSGISPEGSETEVYVTDDGTEYVKGEDGLFYPK